MEERCVCCGAIIAEGRQVCPVCCGISAARTERAQTDLKEAFDRLSEATINARAALERFEMVMKEGRAKNGRCRVDKDHH